MPHPTRNIRKAFANDADFGTVASEHLKMEDGVVTKLRTTPPQPTGDNLLPTSTHSSDTNDLRERRLLRFKYCNGSKVV